jgi:hypothetical protein
VSVVEDVWLYTVRLKESHCKFRPNADTVVIVIPLGFVMSPSPSDSVSMSYAFQGSHTACLILGVDRHASGASGRVRAHNRGE